PCFRSLRQCNILPEILQAFGSSKERGEVRGVDHQNVAGAFLVWREPEQTVELRVARRREWMRPIEIDGLARQQLHGFSIVLRQRIVRQVRMKIESRDII